MTNALAPLRQLTTASLRSLGAENHGRVILLDLILTIALALRVWGLSWGFPWAFHPDEGDYADRALYMLQTGNLNPTYFKNPTLLTYEVAGELLVARAIWPPTRENPTAPNLLARFSAALAGTASVGLLSAIGARLFGRPVGLLAALLLAVSFLHVRDSHYGVNDVPALGLLLASLYFVVRLIQQPALRWYILAGLCGGLATSTKYNMGFFFLPLLVAHGMALVGQGRPLWSGQQARPLLLAATAALLGFLLGTPYALLDWSRFWSDFTSQLALGDASWAGQSLEQVPLQYLLTMVQGCGLVPLLLAAVGVLSGWRERRLTTLLVVSFPLAYLAFLLPKALFFARFALPLLPFCCLLAAIGTMQVVRLARPEWRSAFLMVLVTAALVQSLANDFYHARLLTESDTRVLAANWVHDNLPADSRLKMGEYTLQDTSWRHRTNLPAEIEQRIGPLDLNASTDEVRELIDRRVQYVVISSFTYERSDLDFRSDRYESGQEYGRLYRSLEHEGRLVARFSPGLNNRELPFRLESLYTPFWDLQTYQRTGPTVRIYALTPLGSAGR